MRNVATLLLPIYHRTKKFTDQSVPSYPGYLTMECVDYGTTSPMFDDLGAGAHFGRVGLEGTASRQNFGTDRLRTLRKPGRS